MIRWLSLLLQDSGLSSVANAKATLLMDDRKMLPVEVF
jgi:hypothetical protein